MPRLAAVLVLSALLGACGSDAPDGTANPDDMREFESNDLGEIEDGERGSIISGLQMCDSNTGGYHIDRQCYARYTDGLPRRAVTQALEQAERLGPDWVYAHD